MERPSLWRRSSSELRPCTAWRDGWLPRGSRQLQRSRMAMSSGGSLNLVRPPSQDWEAWIGSSEPCGVSYG
jgi:hypothetical protein